MEQIFENKKLNVIVRAVGKGDKVLFHAKDVAASLGYMDPKKAVKAHVWKKNRTTLGELLKGGDSPPLRTGHPDTVLLYEPGLYQLICGSRLPIAEAFQEWVFEDVLPSIRKTGSYTVPKPKPLEGMQIRLLNETNLHYKVVEFTRRFYPDTIIIAGLGENQDTPGKRIDSKRKGYTKGQPDIILANPRKGFTGFAIELKTPKGCGTVTPEQKNMLTRLEKEGYKTLLSNDYDTVIREICLYMEPENVRVVTKTTAKSRKQRKTPLKFIPMGVVVPNK